MRSATTYDTGARHTGARSETLEQRVRAALHARPGRTSEWVTKQLPAGADWAPWSAPWVAAAAALLELAPEAPPERPAPLPGGGGLYAAPLAEAAPARVITLSAAELASVLAGRAES